mmetsp:Transcript_41576/g.109684  ORF Transcript_41576/g.109684 Transcript_41576/m.109684 type:complete len:83 (+) Transcript_41576:962-1210(+)
MAAAECDADTGSTGAPTCRTGACPASVYPAAAVTTVDAGAGAAASAAVATAAVAADSAAGAVDMVANISAGAAFLRNVTLLP